MRSFSEIVGADAGTGRELTAEEQVQRQCDSYNKHAGDLTGLDCPVCKNKGDVAYLCIDIYPSMVLKPCECMSARRSMWQIEQSGLKDTLKTHTFENFKTVKPYQSEMLTKAKEYVCNPVGWFFLGGQVGCGKTHICTAICNEFLKQNKAVRYMPWRDEVVALKAMVTDLAEYQASIDKFKQTPVLYIDDFFKVEQGKKPTAADVNVAFEIINHRYCNRDLITIISSEKDLYELLDIDEAVGSRIYERCKRTAVNLKGAENYRLVG